MMAFNRYIWYWGSVMPNSDTLVQPEILIPTYPVKDWGSDNSERQLITPTPSTEYVGNMFSMMTPLEMAELCLKRAKSYLSENDPMQASEKLYKATEESIKFLSAYYKLDEFQEAKKQGNWWIGVLSRASKHLTKDTGRAEVDEAWVKAFDLHVNGFHENALNVDDVQLAIPVIEKLIQLVREVSNGG